MNYPTVSEYLESLQCASDNFLTLTSLRLMNDSEGKPIYNNEKHCVIFHMKNINTNVEYDIKCFTDDQEGRESLYNQIQNSLTTWYPFGLTYYAKELFVDTDNSEECEFPIVITRSSNKKNIISFIGANINDKFQLSKLAYSFSLILSWVYEKGYSLHYLDINNLYVEDSGHIVISDLDTIIDKANNDTNEYLSAVLILLSLKALCLDSTILDIDNIKPQILFDINKCYALPTDECFCRLLKTNDSEILSIIGAILISQGQGNLCGLKPVVFRVIPCSDNEFDELKARAEEGDVFKQVELARRYWNNEEYKESYKWYDQSASQNNPEGLFGLGLCYKEGLGIEKDLTKSFQCFLKASETGLTVAQYELGEAYFWGWGVERNEKKAMELFYKAALKGHAESEFMIGHHLMSNHGEIDSSFTITSKRDTVKAFEWYMKSAQQGYHPAQRRIGAFYETGTDPCIRNISRALEWYQKAAAQGNDKALFAIGRLYANGLDERNPDNKKAYDYYLQAANKGLRDAQYRVGIALLFGKGIDKDKKAAMEWIRKSSDQNYPAAKKLMLEIKDNEENAEENEATGLELASAMIDNFGVLYSQDGKKLLKYSLEEGYGEPWDGQTYMFDEEAEFGSIKQQSLNHYKVKEGTEIICANAFDECESLQSITFPQSLKRIGDFAFYQCENLEHVDINEGLEEIGVYAFNGCVNLSTLVIPQSLKYGFVGSTFTGVRNIISNSEKFISDDNCLYTANMRTLIYFFQNGEDYLEIPHGVEIIEDSAFAESDIKDVVIPESIVKIECEAFSKCMELEDVYLPKSIKEIGSAAFYGCENLNKVILPRELEIIGFRAFFNCHNLGYIKFPESVKEILDCAFAFTNIKSVILPKNLEFFGDDPFISCPLTKLESLSDRFAIKDMAIYTDDGKTFVNYYGKERKFEIPTGVEKIADCALSYAYSLQELVIPNTVKEIGKRILVEASPKKISIPLKIKDLLIDKIPSYLADRILVIEDDSD